MPTIKSKGPAVVARNWVTARLGLLNTWWLAPPVADDDVILLGPLVEPPPWSLKLPTHWLVYRVVPLVSASQQSPVEAVSRCRLVLC